MNERKMKDIEIAMRVQSSLDVALAHLDNAVRELRSVEDVIAAESHDVTLKQQEISELASAIHVLRGPVALRHSQWYGYYLARQKDAQ